jgi:putative hemolysin
MPSLFELIVLAGLLLVNALFAAYETALAAVSQARLHALERAGHRGAAAAVFMKTRIERSLAVTQLGMTLVAAIAAAFGGASVEERLAPALEARFGFSPRVAGAIALASIVIPLSALTIVFAELAPKVLALRHREAVCLGLSPPMRLLTGLLAPVVTVLEESVKIVLSLLSRTFRRRRIPQAPEATSLHELAAAAALARTSKLIGAREERIVRSAALLSSRQLLEIELPASDMSMLALDANIETALVRAHLDMHTRFPVARVDHDAQTVVGYVTFKDLIALLKMAGTTMGGAPPTLRAATRPIHRLPRTMTIAAALDRMVRERTHISLVVDDQDVVTGMITLEDILEELIGDIEDEFDRLPAHVQPTGDGFIVGGGITLDSLKQKTGIELAATSPLPTAPPSAPPLAPLAPGSTSGPGGSASTIELARPTMLADWVQRSLGRAPEGGETVKKDGVTLIVRKLRRKRLAEAFVRRNAAALLMLAALVGASARCAAAQEPPRRNAILIVVDTLRRDRLGCYGHSRPTSPNLDRLAAEGTRFTRMTSAAPWTTPAVASLLSSQHPTTLGIHDDACALRDDALLLPEMLAPLGFATGAVVSHSFCSSKWRFDQGFRSFDESNVKGHDAVTSAGVTDRALEFVEQHGAGPFFLWLHYFDPHFGYVAHHEWEFADAPGYGGPITSGMKFRELTKLKRKLAPADVDQLLRFYDSEIAFTDREIGRLLDGLRERGLDANTVIVFTADHGEEFLDHGGLGHTHTLFAELLGVPLIVKVPGRAPAVDDRAAASVDVAPTLLDALGIEAPAGLAGRSLLRLRGEEDEMRPLFSATETPRGTKLARVSLGSLELVRDLVSGGETLFDLAADPKEERDLAPRRASDPELARKATALARTLDSWLAECAAKEKAAPKIEMSEEERQRLKALGYGDD